MDHFTQVKAAEDIKCQSKIRLKSHLWNNYKYLLGFPFKNGTSLAINVQVVPETSSLKNFAALVCFQNRTGVPPWKNQPGWSPWGRISVRLKASFLLCHQKNTDRWFFWTFRFPSVLKQCIQSCLVLRSDTTKITAVSIFFSWQARMALIFDESVRNYTKNRL